MLQINERSERIVELDGVRGVACLMVLFHHYFTGAFNYEFSGVFGFSMQVLSLFFLSGVDLFFVLSGFLVGGIIIDNVKSRNFLSVFFIRRVCRIFPIYFLLILSLSLALIFSQKMDFTRDWLLKHPYPVWTYILFLQSYFFGVGGNSGPVWAAVTWSVSVEEQFYFLMPFVFLFLARLPALVVVCLGIVVAPVIRYVLFNKLGFYASYMFFPARMDTLFWGVLLAYCIRSEVWRRRLLANSVWIIFLIAMIFLALTSEFVAKDVYIKYSLLAAFYTLILWVVLENQFFRLNMFLRGRFLVFTGLISYAIYMFHQLVNGLMHGLFFSSKPIIDSWGRFFTTVASVVLIYILSYISMKYFEAPFRRFGAQFKYQKDLHAG